MNILRGINWKNWQRTPNVGDQRVRFLHPQAAHNACIIGGTKFINIGEIKLKAQKSNTDFTSTAISDYTPCSRGIMKKKESRYCGNCKHRNGSSCKKNSFTVSFYDWCSSWKKVG